MSLRHFFLISCCLERIVCAFLIPSEQVVNVLKHQLVCSIMKASSRAPLLPPQSISARAQSLLTPVFPPMEAATAGGVGKEQAAQSTSA